MPNFCRTFLNGLIMVVLMISHQARADEGPKAVVSDAANAMTERLITDKEKVSSQEYYLETLVDELILPVVDNTYMAKKVLAKNWKKASKEQKKAFTEAFKHKVIRTYAGAFRAFNGETITFADARFNKTGKKASVSSEIHRVGAPAINVTYKLFLKKGNWRVYDVVIEGVSLVKSFRDQFNQRIQKEGLAQAISSLSQEYKSEAPRLKMAGHAWTPYISQQLPANGLAVDLVTTALTRAGYDVEMSFMPWNRVGQGMMNGDIDVSVASWYSESRAREIEFTAPYLTNDLIIVKRKKDKLEYNDVQSFKQYVDDKNYRLGVFENYGYGQTFSDIAPLVDVNYYKYCTNMVRDVASKKSDIALLDRWIAESNLTTNKNIADHLTLMQTPLIKRALHATISRKNPEHKAIADAFNRALEEMKKDGTYESILKRHKFPTT